MKHWAREQREHGAADGARHDVARQGRGSVALVRVEHVGLERAEDEDAGDALGDAGERGYDPEVDNGTSAFFIVEP